MGLVHIYCGNGKGKTTAALGLAVRAAGSGMKVGIFRMIKGNETSEDAVLSTIGNIQVFRPERNFGFTKNLSEEDRQLLTDMHNALLQKVLEDMENNSFDMIVIDEFCAAYNSGTCDISLLERIVCEKPEVCELVLTGRNPPQFALDRADYISEITAVRHPYEKGIGARIGIEY